MLGLHPAPPGCQAEPSCCPEPCRRCGGRAGHERRCRRARLHHVPVVRDGCVGWARLDRRPASRHWPEHSAAAACSSALPAGAPSTSSPVPPKPPPNPTLSLPPPLCAPPRRQVCRASGPSLRVQVPCVRAGRNEHPLLAGRQVTAGAAAAAASPGLSLPWAWSGGPRQRRRRHGRDSSALTPSGSAPAAQAAGLLAARECTHSLHGGTIQTQALAPNSCDASMKGRMLTVKNEVRNVMSGRAQQRYTMQQ